MKTLMNTAPDPCRTSSKGGYGTFRAVRLLLLVLVLCLGVSGCCLKWYGDVFRGLIANGKSVIRTVELVSSQQYISAITEVVKVVSSISAGCPPKPIPPAVLDKLPIEMDFNILHEYFDGNGQVQISTVPPVSPEEMQTEEDVQRLYGISEADNYKFVFASHRSLYIYVFQIDSTGKVDWQYPKYDETAMQKDKQANPNPEEINNWPEARGTNPTPAEQVVRMPDNEEDWYYLDTNGRNGVENIFVIASKFRQEGLEEALRNAVEAAQKAKASDPKAFTETAVKLPLIIPEGQSGLTNEEGQAAGNAKTIKTPQGQMVSYTPRQFTSKDNKEDSTILFVRSFMHLPPRNK